MSKMDRIDIDILDCNVKANRVSIWTQMRRSIAASNIPGDSIFHIVMFVQNAAKQPVWGSVRNSVYWPTRNE